MRSKILILSGILVFAVYGIQGCSSKEVKDENGSEGIESAETSKKGGAEDLNQQAALDQVAVQETSEQDLNKEVANSTPAAPAPNENVPPPPTEEPPPPAMEPSNQAAAAPTDVAPPPAENAPAPEVPQSNEALYGGETAPVKTGKPARVTGLDFNANLNGGTVSIKTNKPVTYTTRKNDATNQYVIELDHTIVPKKFKRPYNTKEFGSAIAAINAYQARGKAKITRIVLQLRPGSGEPQISQEGKVISVAAAGGAAPTQEMAQANPAAGPDEAAQAQNAEVPAVAPEAGGEQAAAEGAEGSALMENRGLETFLTGSSKFYGRPISIDLKDADIKEAFRMISDESGLNIVTTDDVNGKITLHLQKIPWDQALAVIMQSKQLGYVKQGSVLRIAPLKTLQAESDTARSVMDSQRALQPLKVNLFPMSYAKAEELEAQVKDFLSPRGKAKADKRTNTLVVTDIDENLSRIKTLVKRLDTQTPQVMIEAKIVEARETFQRLIGVNWGFSGAAGSSSPSMTPTFSNSPISGQTAATASLGLTYGTLAVIGDLNASLKLMEIENQVKVISAPRIVTLDRKAAKIEQTTQFPIFSSSTSSTGTAISTVSFQDVKLQLDVTPQITVDGGIIMDVNVLREFPDPVTSPPNSSSQARAVNRRQAQTQVLVENGDTVVIGGIYQSDVGDGENGIPWLRNLPVVGWLFKSKTSRKTKTNW